jgi:hypothetical protein
MLSKKVKWKYEENTSKYVPQLERVLITRRKKKIMGITRPIKRKMAAV